MSEKKEQNKQDNSQPKPFFEVDVDPLGGLVDVVFGGIFRGLPITEVKAEPEDKGGKGNAGEEPETKRSKQDANPVNVTVNLGNLFRKPKRSKSASTKEEGKTAGKQDQETDDSSSE